MSPTPPMLACHPHKHAIHVTRASAYSMPFLKYLDFTIHEAKSILKPTHRIKFLGFINDSTKMVVTISNKEMIANTNKIKKLMATTFPTIRLWAFVIGPVISLFPAVPLGKLHFIAFEKDKSIVFKKAYGNFDKILAKNNVKAIN